MVDPTKYTDDELQNALAELDEWHDTTILCNGIIRNIAREIKRETESTVLDLMGAEMVVYREIAKRWRVNRG